MNIFDKITNLVASISGLDTSYLNLSPEQDIHNHISRGTFQYRNLCDLLTYRYFDRSNLIFVNEGNVISSMLELSPVVGITENLIKNLEHFFSHEMPASSHIEFLLIASADISSNLEFWEANKKFDKRILKRIFRERGRFLMDKSKNFHNSDFIFPRNYRLYLSYSKRAENCEYELPKHQVFIRNLMQKLGAIGLNPTMCNAQDLVGLIREILEFDAGGELKYNPNMLLSDQILKLGCNHKISKDGIDHRDAGLTSRLYYPGEYPKEFSLHHMIKLLGDGERDYLSIPGRFLISYVVSNDINGAHSNSIIQKGNRIIDSAEQWYSRNNRDIKREAAEWKDVNDKSKNGEKFLTEALQIMLTVDKDFIDSAEQNLFSLYQILDWKLVRNKYFHLPAMLSILPMQSIYMWQYLKYFKLSRIALSKEVGAKLPIHGEYKGVPEPGMLLLARRGQLFHWNPYYRLSSGNYNICVFGPSGSGKSVFLQELAVNMIAQRVKIFILDIGKSFKNICMLLDGEIIEFGKNNRIILNPFSEFKDDISKDDRSVVIAYAKSIICAMCNSKGDAIKESIIEKTIIKGLENFGANFSISKLSELLYEHDDDAARNLALSLFSYTKEGLYGSFFDENIEANQIGFDKDITIFEFEEIKNNGLLLSVVLQIIGMQIFMQILTGDRSQKFMLIVDEAWMILDHSAKFLAEFARTIRKYGGSLVVCVQNYNDLAKGEYQNAILQNSSWTILLKQDEKGINSFRESDAFKDIIPLIRSISIAKDKYAEMLIFATDLKIVGRLVLDPYSKIMFSTDSEIFSRIQSLLSEGYVLEEIISQIAKEKYPNYRVR